MQIIHQKSYAELLQNVKERVLASQYEALKSVNKELIGLYWDIGRMIVERQEKEGWGKAIVENLSLDMQKEFPGMLGFSASGLWRMRNFYQIYYQNEKLAPLVREIGWTHNIIIFERCKDDLEREFYIRMTKKYGWSKNILTIKIEGKTYESTLINQTNFEKTVPDSIKKQAKLAIKDEYTFGFLELAEDYSEHDFEKAILSRMDRFLREMGGAISFVGSQYRLEVGNKEFFVDILLYHRHLKSLLALELKVGEFLPEYVGKMQFYLAVLDDKVRIEGENPSIGIIICKEKNRTIVEYALKESNKPIGVAEYNIVKSIPKNLKGELPTPEQIEILIKGV